MSKLIIMVASFAPQAGKTTFTKELGKGKLLSFADPMKRMLHKLFQDYAGYSFSESVEALWGSDKAEPFKLSSNHEVTHRKMMQTLGTEWRLALGYESLWADILKSKLDCKGYALALIDDWRFLNEYNVIKDLEKDGFKVITVCIRNTTAEANYTGSHSSEGELKDFAFDHVVTNDGSMSDFIAKVHQFAENLGDQA